MLIWYGLNGVILGCEHAVERGVIFGCDWV